MKLKHYDHDGRARFVTFCTHQKLPVLTNHVFKDIVVNCLFEICRDYKLRLLGYVAMPEHVHLVVVPPEATELGPVIGEFKRITARRIHQLVRNAPSGLLEKLMTVRNSKTRFVLWQRRCHDHNCRTPESVWEKVNYCHNNPVKRGLVRQPEDWQWSSYRYYGAGDNVLLEIDVSA